VRDGDAIPVGGRKAQCQCNPRRAPGMYRHACRYTYIYLYPEKGFRVLCGLGLFAFRGPGGRAPALKNSPLLGPGPIFEHAGCGPGRWGAVGTLLATLGALLAEQRPQDRERRLQERPQTDNIDRKSSLRPRTETARAAKDHPRSRRSHSRSRNKHVFKAAMFFTFFSPRPPT